MTTHNHTAIATGAAANASTINTPLGTIDAAIGNLTTLTTTAKTSAVAAINEHETQIGDLTTLTTTAKTSLVAAINEVDASASGGQVNLAWDPINAHYAVGQSPDTRTRWYSTATLATVNPDSNNPFQKPTVRIASGTGNAGGRRFWLDEMGLKVGDYVSIALLVKMPTTMSFRLALTQRNSAGTVVTSASSNLIAGTGAVQLLYQTTLSFQILANAISLDLFVALRAGTGDIDIYGWYIVRGQSIGDPDKLTTLGLDDGARAMRLLETARGTLASLDARLDVSLNENGTLKATPTADLYSASAISYGRHLLRSWLAQLAKIRYGDTEQAIIAFVGDSWVNGPDRITGPVAAWLHTEYGHAGAGFVSAYEGTKTEPADVTRTRVGTWTDHTASTTPAGRGPDATDSYSVDTATPAKLTYVAVATECVIHYYQQAGGGSFRWRVDAGGWTTVSTDGAAAHATAAISGLSDASHTIEIEISTAGAAGVTLYGVDLQRPPSGVRVHKIGDGGATAARYLALDATQWQAAITALAPDCVVLVFGTNEDAADVAPATYVANMEALAARVRAALPLCDILYLPPGSNGLAAGTYTMTDYVGLLRNSATANDYAMHDSVLLFGAYADANSRGLWGDTSHINAQGGRLLAGSLINELLFLP